MLNDIGFKRPPLQDKDEFAIKGITKEQIPNMDGIIYSISHLIKTRIRIMKEIH